MIIVTRETGSVNVQKYVTEIYNGKLVIDLVVVPDLTGGAESLIHIKPKLKVSSFHQYKFITFSLFDHHEIVKFLSLNFLQSFFQRSYIYFSLFERETSLQSQMI